MVNDLDQLAGARRPGFSPDYVLGVVLEGEAKAYYYEDVSRLGLVNDSFAGLPIVIWSDETSLQAYIRQVDGRTLTFELVEGLVTDRETGSSWNLARGHAVAGPLRGTALQPVPRSSAFDWAWRDFYPHSEFYSP